MAKHKTATQVTVVHEERSSFGKLVDRFWKPAAAVAVLGAGLIVGSQYSRTKSQEADASQWDTVRAAINVNTFSGQMEGSAEALQTALDGVDGSAKAWGEVALVSALVEQRDYDKALAALTRVRSLDLPAFNDAFRVDAEHDDFAIALLSAEMQQFLLEKPTVDWSVGHGHLKLFYRGRLRRSRMDRSLDRLRRFWRQVAPELMEWTG